MDRVLQTILFERHPKIFVEKDLPLGESAMGRGIATEDGWFDLIDVLCAQLQRETDEEGGHQVVASQVKEKFGTLRFRARGASERQRAMIGLAEELSARICERCGGPGRLMAQDVTATLCEPCRARGEHSGFTQPP